MLFFFVNSMVHPDSTTEDFHSDERAVSETPLPRLEPDRRIIEGGAPNLAKETRDLLHRGLFAASLMLALPGPHARRQRGRGGGRAGLLQRT